MRNTILEASIKVKHLLEILRKNNVNEPTIERIVDAIEKHKKAAEPLANTLIAICPGIETL